MVRVRSGFISGTVTNNPLSNSGTTLNSAELSSLPAVVSPDMAVIILDPLGVSGAPEIVYVTAHTAAATSATIRRAMEGTTGRQHAAGTAWVHGPTTVDFNYKKGANIASASELVLPNSDEDFFNITGTTTINTIRGPLLEPRMGGQRITFYFSSSLTLNHNGSAGSGFPIAFPDGLNLTVFAGDLLTLVNDETAWRLVGYSRGQTQGWQVVGRNSTEQTTTSTSPVDLVTISSLAIPVTSWVRISGNMRKSAGHASACGIGLKINSTTVLEASSGGPISGSTSEAQSGAFVILIAPRATNYLRGVSGNFTWSGATDNAPGAIPRSGQLFDADLPNATITSIAIRGDTANASNTVGVKNVVVEALADG